MKKLAGLVAAVALVVAGAAMWGGDTAEAEEQLCYGDIYCTTEANFEADCIAQGGVYSETVYEQRCMWSLGGGGEYGWVPKKSDAPPPPPPAKPSYCKALGWVAVFVKACR